MRPWTLFVIAIVVCTIAPAGPAAAWGFDGHRLIADRAVDQLPPELRPFFERYRRTFVERSIDPDLWITAGFDDEAPRHYVNLDSYGPPPFASVPRELGSALEVFGRRTVDERGTLPWRGAEMYGNLVRAFRNHADPKTAARTVDSIPLLAAALAHYASDATQPLHAVVNYDGRLTGQAGVHSRFESGLIERFVARLTLTPPPMFPVSDPRTFLFESLFQSFASAQSVLDADAAAIGTGIEYDDAYFERFFSNGRGVLEASLSRAIASVAAIIAGAWEQAGRPQMVLEPRPPVQRKSSQ